jgi:hypothetical protein
MRPDGINRRFDGFLLRTKIDGVGSKRMTRWMVPARVKLTIFTKDEYSVRQTVAVFMRLVVHNFVFRIGQGCLPTSHFDNMSKARADL